MNSADTADQMMKMTLEGIQVAAEVGLKAGGMAARSLAVTLYAILKDNKKVKGKTNLNNLLKSDKELKVSLLKVREQNKSVCQLMLLYFLYHINEPNILGKARFHQGNSYDL